MSEMWYNLTAVDGTNLLTFTQYVNKELMLNLLGILFLIMIWAVIFYNLSLNNQDTALNLTIPTFVVAVLSVPLFILDLVPNYVPFVSWGFFAIAIVIMLLQR
jgi:hypothetical protein